MEKITITQKKNKTGAILTGLSVIADRPLDKDGNLDVVAFNKLPEVIKAKNKLKALGADKKFLSTYFWVAAMVLTGIK